MKGPVAAALAGLAAGLLAMGLFQWHLSAHWTGLYAQHPAASTGLSPAVLASQPADYLASSLALRGVFAGTAMLACLLALAFPRRVLPAAAGLFAGAWLVPAVVLVGTAGSFSSNLGPLAVLVNGLLSAGVLGIATVAGAAPGALANALRSRLAR